MAFFKTPAHHNYFSIFYYKDAQDRISGAFHALTDAQYKTLKKLYAAAAIYLGILFLIQTVLMISDFSYQVKLFPQAYVAFFILTPIAPLVVAIFIAPKTKLPIESMKMELELQPSTTVYVMVILTCLLMAESTVWLTLSNESMPGVAIWMAMFIFVSFAALYRLISIRNQRI